MFKSFSASTERSIFITFIILLLVILSVDQARSEMETIGKSTLRNITGREGMDLRFNLELGDEFNSTGENVHLNIRDGDGFGGGTSRNLSILDLWLTLNIGSSDDNAIAIDTVNTSGPPVLQLSMGNNDTFSGFEAEVESGIYVRNSQTGTGGTVGIDGLNINDGGFGAGSLDFDGQLQIWGADPP